ncbi:MAG: murein hydrolase activator EnvC family protein [Oscillospiraceae bacterium]
MGRTGLMKKMLAFSLALITAVTVVAGGKDSIVNEKSVSATSSEAKENAAAIKKAQTDIDKLEEQQEALDKKIKEAQEDIESEQQVQADIDEQISLVEKTIEKYDVTIQKYNEDISDLSKEIEKSEKNIEQKQQEIEQGVEDFKKRIRVMYINGTDSYTDILIGAKDFYDMLMKIELVKRVANHDNEMIDNLVELKRQYESEKEVLEENKKDLEEKRKEQQTQKDKQQAQKDKLTELYSKSIAAEEQLKKAEAAYKKNQESLKAEQAEFEADLQALYKKEEKRKKKEAEEAERKRQELLAQQQQQQSSSGGATNNTDQGSTDNSDHGYTDKSQFTWPVPGFYHITYGVGWRWGAYHQGIDISSANIRGAKICAAASGTVIRVVNGCTHDYGKSGSCGCGGGYGNYCIIDHGNGYWTLYGHSEGITVSVGQYVNQGDVIGTVGSTGFSTGPHLHFEIRLNGVAQNPSNYV